MEIQHGKKNYTLKWEYQILHMGLSTADSKQVLCHMILFKVLSLGLLRSLWHISNAIGHLYVTHREQL